MATEEMFTSLPTVTTAQMSDIICAVQGYVSPTVLGLSVQENLQQIYNLFQSNIILFNAGNPNGLLAGTTYQFCWDTTDYILFICTTSGTATTAVWNRADINNGFTTTVTAAATTTLTILSNYWQFFTGSTTQTVVMPVTSTLAAGMTWNIVNNSSGVVTIQSSGLNTIVTLAAGESALITCITNTGTTASSWNSLVSSAGGGVISITGTANEIIASSATGAVTLSTPQPIATTSSPTFASLTLTSPLSIGNGGNGVNSVTTAPTATAWTGWDANKNLSANNFIPTFVTTVSSATPIVLLVSSAELQYISGTTAQTITMPVASTLVAGMSWTLVNLSTATTTVNSSGGNLIVSLPAASQATVTCILNSGTTAASWSADFILNTSGVSSITGTANEIIASASTGAITLSTPQAIATTSTPTFAGVILPNSATAFAGLKAPTIQKFTSASGTYTTPTSPVPLYIRVLAVGGGGGGAGTGSSGIGASSAGGNTTFGTTLIVANGGSGAASNSPGAGGSTSLGAAIGYSQTGATGSQGGTAANSTGGGGGVSFFSGGGAGAGGTAITNSGSGGGGSGGGAAFVAGGGGGAGGFVDGIISSPSVTYSYAVGGSGSGGSAGAGGGAGGAGAAGQIIVYEYYE